jgi:Fe-S oxidoreductase
MYYYIFDSFLNAPAYEKYVQDINAALNDLTVQGERARISPVRRLPDIMRDASAKKIETVVMIGNEESFSKAIEYALQYNFTLGYFPVAPDDELGIELGVSTPEAASRALSARRIEELYPLSINNTYFITRVRARINEEKKKKGFFSFLGSRSHATDVRMLFDENYFVSGEFEELTIYNTRSDSENPLVSKKKIEATDQSFEVAFTARLPKYKDMRHRGNISKDDYRKMSPYNLLRAHKVEVLSPQDLEFTASGQVVAQVPCVVTAAQKKIRIIAGKNARF